MEILDALANIGFDWRIAVANFINFVIIYFLLNRYVFGPLTETLDQRREKIESGLQYAEDAEVLRQKAETEREEILRSARNEAVEIVSVARQKESEVIEGASDKASQEAEKIIIEARQKADSEYQSMMKQFQSKAASLVVAATEKMLGDEIVNGNKEKVAEKYLNSVDK